MSKSKEVLFVTAFALTLSVPIRTEPAKITHEQVEFMEDYKAKLQKEKIELEKERQANLEIAKTFKSTHGEYIKSNDEIEAEKAALEAKRIAEEITKRPYREVKCELTFYTSLAVCNGPNAGRNAVGGYLTETSIAVPSINGKPLIPYGTRIDIGSAYGERIADDTGSERYIRIREDGTYVFDVYMPRLKGESDSAYKARIMKMGRIKTTAKIYDN